jgi:hypothetical protein
MAPYGGGSAGFDDARLATLVAHWCQAIASADAGSAVCSAGALLPSHAGYQPVTSLAEGPALPVEQPTDVRQIA